MPYASGQVGWRDAAEEGEAMDNYTLTMLSIIGFLMIFVPIVERLTREDRRQKDKPK
jgi:hypothetical protein